MIEMLIALSYGGIAGFVYFGGLFLQLKRMLNSSVFFLGFFFRLMVVGVLVFSAFKMFSWKAVVIFFIGFFCVLFIFTMKKKKVSDGNKS